MGCRTEAIHCLGRCSLRTASILALCRDARYMYMCVDQARTGKRVRAHL